MMIVLLLYWGAAYGVQTKMLCDLVLSNPELLPEVCSNIRHYIATNETDSPIVSVAGFSTFGRLTLYENLDQSQLSSNSIRNLSANVRTYERYRQVVEQAGRTLSLDMNQELVFMLMTGRFQQFIRELGGEQLTDERINATFVPNNNYQLVRARSLAHLYVTTIPGFIEDGLIDSYKPEDRNRLGSVMGYVISNLAAVVTPSDIMALLTWSEENEARWGRQRSTLLTSMNRFSLSIFSIRHLYADSVIRIQKCPQSDGLDGLTVAEVCPYNEVSRNYVEWRHDHRRDRKKFFRQYVRSKINPKPGVGNLIQAARTLSGF